MLKASNYHIKICNACDYIPVVSTFSNVVKLFNNCIVEPLKNKNLNNKSWIDNHLKNKKVLRNLILLVPVIGNIIYVIYDLVNTIIFYKTLSLVKLNPVALKYAADELKKDREIVLAAVKNDGLALEYAADELKKDRDFILAAVKINGLALEYASDELKKDRDIVLAAVKR